MLEELGGTFEISSAVFLHCPAVWHELPPLTRLYLLAGYKPSA